MLSESLCLNTRLDVFFLSQSNHFNSHEPNICLILQRFSFHLHLLTFGERKIIAIYFDKRFIGKQIVKRTSRGKIPLEKKIYSLDVDAAKSCRNQESVRKSLEMNEC